jgi:TetR/AcrR family transcriptional repressor of lmrAB and yxaGH operons
VIAEALRTYRPIYIIPDVPEKGASSKAKMILATLDLLRGSGLAGAGINPIVEASGAPKGSLYHFFPAGKNQLVTAALKEAERAVGDGFRNVFGQSVPFSQKVRTLFSATATRIEASEFTKGCPVAAVTLDIDDESKELRTVCQGVFATWREIIAAGLDEVPAAQRREVAQLILAALEGALILARATATKDPLLQTGELLANTLSLTVAPKSDRMRRPRQARGRRERRRSRS